MGSTWNLAAIDSENGLWNGQKHSWEELERQDWRLWILAVGLLFILGASLLCFMFPPAFWFGGKLAENLQQRAFWGFSTLMGLVLVYLIQRQATIRSLKRQLFEAQSTITANERRTYQQVFLTLPGRDQMRDALAMEFRRAASGGKHVSLGLLRVWKASQEEMGHAVTLLRPLLCEEEILARISDTTLGIIFPEMEPAKATALLERAKNCVATQMQDAQINTTVVAYPQGAASLAELERPLRAA